MSHWMDRAGPSTPVAERRPLVFAGRVPRSYGSLFPYYKFVRDAIEEPVHRAQVGSFACQSGVTVLSRRFSIALAK